MNFFLLSFLLMGVGALVTLTGAIWGIVVAFKQGTGWGLLMLAGFFSGVQILSWAVFALKHFDEAYPSFLTYLGGLLPLALGVAMFFFEAALMVAST